MNDPRLFQGTAAARGSVGEPVRHESAHLHVSGEAAYTDDIREARGTLHAAFGLSQRAHARIKAMDLAAVRAAPGVAAVITAADIPGANDVGPILHDDPILAADEVQYLGQPIFLVAAETVDEARRAARLATVEYEELPAILTIEDALSRQSFVLPTVTLERGDWGAALAGAPHRLKGSFRIGGQEQFYLEGQVAYAVPKEDGDMLVYSSTQHPGEVQMVVAHALRVGVHRVVVECRRMGGGFGGKETQAALPAAAAAVMARHTGRPVKLRYDRDDDITITGKRHDYLVEYEVGFDGAGRILGLDLMFASRCGFSADLSGPINDRTVMHADNCYWLPNVRIVSHRCRTHTQSNTAFRGFGGPQGMLGSEHVVDEIAHHLGLDPLAVRKANFYGASRDLTPYGMQVEDFVADRLFDELERSSEYGLRRDAIRKWNATSPIVKRGIAMTPVKFGIAFTATFFNQASALVHVYQGDGSVLLNHGGTEMGQGLFTKVAQVVAHEFGIDLDRVRVSASDTARIPNASATAASSGSDLNGKAAQAAAREIKARLVAFAAERFKVSPESIRFAANHVEVGEHRLTFAELVRMAYLARVQLWAGGFYKTPKIHYDPKTLKGRPFFYFAYGAAVSEVAIDTLTGETKLLRADILHDVGRSLNPAIDLGQIEGGFVQGMGWLTSEELWWDGRGKLMTHAPSTYKIPVASDVPADFRVQLWARGENVEDSIHRSKAVGEPPLMLAMSVLHAIRDAVASVSAYRLSPRLNAPATPEEVLRAVTDVKARAAEAEQRKAAA
ncbi:MAG TPA: xanthine dehydrogenase molybdopterin binding subunit [Burkholderiales bacterium]|nr:xanthine dehydrogenase molybdopterin binding subunit [Burkholderiales bacterium]